MQKDHQKFFQRLFLLGAVALILLLLLPALFNRVSGQASCANPAGTIVLNTEPDTCYLIPATDTVDVCFTFTAPGAVLLFTSVPPGSCTALSISAVLYDASCNVVSGNAFGVVFVTPGQSYVWCLHYVCTGGVHDTVFCPEYFDFSNPVPVTWLNVAGKYCADKDYVKLWWVTSSETNNDRFEIEHGLTGKNFAVIGEEKGKGNSSTINEYRFVHINPADGTNIYRIKQVDYNGAYTYSKPVMIHKPAAGDLYNEVYDITGRYMGYLRDDELAELEDGVYIIRNGNLVRKWVKCLVK